MQFLVSANNSLDWNTFYNFYFDSDAAPVAGLVDIDQARPGPGGITVDVATTVPGLLGTDYLGAGQAPIDLAVQVVEFYPGGPFLGFGALSNGLRIRVAGSGCQ